MSIFTDILKICLTSLVSIVVLFLFCRLGGQRQISQLSMFDYINSITIGSIAAEFATDLEKWWQPLTATIVYGIICALINILCCKSLRLRKFLIGSPVPLYHNGQLYKGNLLRARLNVNEFLAQCRMAGYFDLDQLEAAILETSGQISFLPKAQSRPVTPSDLALSPTPDQLAVNLILDGKLLTENLKHCGKDRKWLEAQLRRQGIRKIEDVFLAVYAGEGHFTAFRDLQTPKQDPFFS